MSFMSAIMGKSASEQAAMPQAAQPAQPAQPEAPKQVEIPDPMDIYAKMFEKSAAVQTEGPPAFNLDSNTLQEVSSKMDFMRGVPQ